MAAASEPSSLISMKIFCNALPTFKGMLERRVKSASSLNIVFKPIYDRSVSLSCEIYQYFSMSQLFKTYFATCLPWIKYLSNLW